MTDFPSGTRSAFARAVSAEIRAAMAARRITGRALAAEAGFASHNYLAIRLRDEKPLTLDDVDRICAFLDEDCDKFIQRAHDNHAERLWVEGTDETRKAELRDGASGDTLSARPATTNLAQDDVALVALDGDEEAGASEFDD